MNKILSITMLIMIGGAMTIALIVAWLMGMLYLLINEIIGTKKFAVKFRKINTIIAEEFKDIIRGIRSIFVESK
jgi:hypothetical protein